MAKRKPAEEIIDKIKTEVAKKVFAKLGPLKKFPDDFLDEATKKDLAIPIKYPKLLKSGIKIVGREHRIVREKIDPKKVNEIYELLKEWQKGAEAKYEEILLPDGKLQIGDMKKKVQIRSERGMTILEVDSLYKAKYVLYGRKKGKWVYKIPKDENAVKKAVKDYEKYIKEIKEKLKKAFIKRGADRTIAERLVMQVFEEKLSYQLSVIS